MMYPSLELCKAAPFGTTYQFYVTFLFQNVGCRNELKSAKIGWEDLYENE